MVFWWVGLLHFVNWIKERTASHWCLWCNFYHQKLFCLSDVFSLSWSRPGLRKDFHTAPYINYTCITVILTLFQKRIEFESQKACVINVWGCAEILLRIAIHNFAQWALSKLTKCSLSPLRNVARIRAARREETHTKPSSKVSVCVQHTGNNLTSL